MDIAHSVTWANLILLGVEFENLGNSLLQRIFGTSKQKKPMKCNAKDKLLRCNSSLSHAMKLFIISLKIV